MKTNVQLKALEILSAARLGAGAMAREKSQGFYFYERGQVVMRKKPRKKAGTIYKRGRVYWIQYYAHGKPYQESTKSEELDGGRSEI